MADLDEWVRPEMVEKLYRRDLGIPDSDERLSFIHSRIPQILELIKYAQEWTVVPSTIVRRTCDWQAKLNQCQSLCSDLLKNIIAANSPEGYLKLRDEVNAMCVQVKARLDEIDRQCGDLREIYRLSKGLSGLPQLNATIEGINEKIRGLGSALEKTAQVQRDLLAKVCEDATTRVGRTQEEFSKHLASATNEHEEFVKQIHQLAKDSNESLAQTVKDLKTELATAAKDGQECLVKQKKELETADFLVKNAAMTTFGKSFGDEADNAAWNGRKAGIIACSAAILLAGVLWTFAFPSGVLAQWIFGALTETETSSAFGIARWLGVRIAMIGLFSWLIGHFLRERNNFLHVAVNNRHRCNLCNAYIAVAEKMQPVEREKYLNTIMPHLAELGKTGFITKDAASPVERLVDRTIGTVNAMTDKVKP